MVRKSCPYCGERLKKREYAVHIAAVHKIGLRREEEFTCLDGCVRCCVDEGMPLELTLGDMVRVSKHLGISMEKLFEDYCQMMWNRIPNTPYFLPSTGLVFPCGFLKGEECVIYDVRPLHCRLFPENILISNFEDLTPLKGTGYECVDKGFAISEERAEAIRKLSEIDEAELEATADYLENINHSVPISEADYGKIMSHVANFDPLERNGVQRALFMELLSKRLDLNTIEKAFLEKIRTLDGEKELEKYDLFK